jgi:predicted permease
MAPGFQALPPDLIDALVPLDARQAWDPAWQPEPETCCLHVAARLAAGLTRAKALAELNAVALARLRLSMPRFNALELEDTTVGGRPGGLRRTVPMVLALLFAGAGLVLLLACANVGNLQLARGLSRRRELSVRLSLGASRGRVVRQLVTESLTLCCVAGGAATVIGLLASRFAWSQLDAEIGLQFTADAHVIAFALAMTASTSLLSSIAPALRVTRGEGAGAWRDVQRGSGSLRSFLLGVQVATSLVLALSAVLLVRSVVVTLNADGGFALHDVSVARIMKPASAYDGPANAALLSAVAASLAGQSGRFAITDAPPLMHRTGTEPISVSPLNQAASAALIPMSSSGLGVLGIPLLAGRLNADEGAAMEAVVNETAARLYWNGADAIGQEVTVTQDGRRYTVVGIAQDASLSEPGMTRPTVHVAQVTPSLRFVLYRTSSESEARLKHIIGAVDARVQIAPVSLSSAAADLLKGSIIGAAVASGIGLLAMALAVVGVFGVCSFIVEERRREIGIRLALGANKWDVGRMMAAVTRRPLIAGTIAGTALAVAAGFALRNFLLGVSPIDPASYGIVTVLLLAAAAVATFGPLRRAARVDPAITLRSE